MLMVLVLALTPHPLPAEGNNGSLLVRAVLNENDVTLLVDTGAELSVIDTASATRLSLQQMGETNLEMVSNDQVVPLSLVPDIRINDVHFRNLKVAVMDLSAMSAALGSHLDGILGVDVLQHFLVRLDYAGGLVRLDPLGQPIGRPSFRLHVSRNRYFVPLSIRGSSFDFLLDTGTNTSLISHAGWLKIQRQQKMPLLLGGLRSSNSASTFSLTSLDSVAIASHLYKNVPVRVSTGKEDGLLKDPHFDGLLGNDFLERFIVTMDLSHGRMSLLPSPNYRAQLFRFSTIGVQFVRDDPSNILIVAVWTPSPAEDVGLQVGDRILAIDGVTTRNMSLDEIGMKLHGPAGKRVALELQAKDGTREVALVIRDLLQHGPSHAQPSVVGRSR